MLTLRSRIRIRSRGRLSGLAAWLLAGALLLLPVGLTAQSTHVLVVTGLGGAPEYSERFAEWGSGLVDAAVEAGVPAENVTWLAERASVAGADGAARREAVVDAVASLGDRSVSGDLVLVALFGHGSARGDEVRINLPGPDLSAGELATLLEPLSDRRVVVVNAASASGGFVAPLSAPGRVVITATRSTRENQATRFGGYFVDALSGDGADTDKDGRVSMLEAFEFARLEVARSYSEAGHLPTEHALLDDDGDGRGTLEPTARPGAGAAAGAGGDDAPSDGRLAATLALAPAPAGAVGEAVAGPAADTALGGLRAEQARLESELDALRARRDSMSEDAYQAELEALLLEIARNGRAIREAESTDPERGAEGGGQ